MKVQEVIKELQKLNPEDNIIIAWWEKSLVEEWFNDDAESQEKETIPEEIWEEVVEEVNSTDWSDIGDYIERTVEEKRLS
jgi:hypothetical protein